MRTAYCLWARAAALAGGAALLAPAGAQAQASGPCALAGTADLTQVAGLPAAADLVVAGYAPTAADPYQHRPVWQAAFAYAGQTSLAYRAEGLPAGRFVVFSFLDANRNGVFEPAEKLARIPGTVALSGTTTGATVNYPEDCSFYTPGWTALDYFTQNPKPNFSPATTLPYLTKFSWGESDSIALELGAHWRYAVSVNVNGETDYPGGDRPLVAALLAAPGRYKVQSIKVLSNTYRDDALRARFPSAYLLDSVTNTRLNNVSPAAPDSLFKFLGQLWADEFAGVRKVYPGFQVDYLLNGGESGMELPVSGKGEGTGTGPWTRDLAVMRDKSAWDAQFGYDNNWYLYASDRKAQQEAWVNNTAKAGIAAAQGFAPTLTTYGAGYNPSLGRWYGCYWYDVAYEPYLRFNAVDYSSTQFYYGPDGGHSGMTYLNFQVAGSPIKATNVYAGEVQYGQRISKPYLSCGWISGDNNSVSPPDRWMGFLKFEALCGGVSPTVANFDELTETLQQREFGAVVANDNHMQWIWQYFVSSHAHAAFTHLEDYITGGALVADPINNHPYNQDPYYPAARPMYMFIPKGEYDGGVPGCADAQCNPYEGGVGYKAVVLARKLDGQDKYVVLAWANTGEDRLVKVAIPGLDTLSLYARKAGTIYQIEGTGAARTLALLDPGAMNPAACLGPTPGVSTPPAGESLGGTYRLLARHSGQALDVAGAGTADGTRVQQWTPNGGAAQQWRVEAAGGGYYTLTAQHSGKALDVEGASGADGAYVQQWSYAGGANQQWAIEPTGDGYYTLTARHSGKALDVEGASGAEGARVQQWPYAGYANQQWKLERVDAARTTPLAPAAAAAAAPAAEMALQAFPNPSAGTATLRYHLARAGAVRLEVRDVLGRAVARPVDGPQAAGWHEVPLALPAAPDGLYQAVLTGPAGRQTAKLLLQR